MDKQKTLTKIYNKYGCKSERSFVFKVLCDGVKKESKYKAFNRMTDDNKISEITRWALEKNLNLNELFYYPPPEADKMPNIVDELNRIGINIASKMGESIGEIKSEMKRCNDRLDLIESHLGIKKTSSNGNSY